MIITENEKGRKYPVTIILNHFDICALIGCSIDRSLKRVIILPHFPRFVKTFIKIFLRTAIIAELRTNPLDKCPEKGYNNYGFAITNLDRGS